MSLVLGGGGYAVHEHQASARTTEAIRVALDLVERARLCLAAGDAEACVLRAREAADAVRGVPGTLGTAAEAKALEGDGHAASARPREALEAWGLAVLWTDAAPLRARTLRKLALLHLGRGEARAALDALGRVDAAALTPRERAGLALERGRALLRAGDLGAAAEALLSASRDAALDDDGRALAERGAALARALAPETSRDGLGPPLAVGRLAATAAPVLAAQAAVAEVGTAAVVLLGAGLEGAPAPVLVPGPGPLSALALADLDRDGDGDLLVAGPPASPDEWRLPSDDRPDELRVVDPQGQAPAAPLARAALSGRVPRGGLVVLAPGHAEPPLVLVAPYDPLRPVGALVLTGGLAPSDAAGALPGLAGPGGRVVAACALGRVDHPGELLVLATRGGGDVGLRVLDPGGAELRVAAELAGPAPMAVAGLEAGTFAALREDGGLEVVALERGRTLRRVSSVEPSPGTSRGLLLAGGDVDADSSADVAWVVEHHGEGGAVGAVLHVLAGGATWAIGLGDVPLDLRLVDLDGDRDAEVVLAFEGRLVIRGLR